MKILLMVLTLLSSVFVPLSIYAASDYEVSDQNDCYAAGICVPNGEYSVAIHNCKSLIEKHKGKIDLDFRKAITSVRRFNGGILKELWEGKDFTHVTLQINSEEYGNVQFECALSHHFVVVDVFEPLYKTEVNLELRKNALENHWYTKKKSKKEKK